MDEIDFNLLKKMVQAAADEINQHKGHLSELDAFIGDGDHGTTIARTMEVMLAAVANGPKDNLKAVLEKIGWEILGVSGGATGPLFGSLFLGLAEGMTAGEKINLKALPQMFKRAEERVLKVSGASAGDKTMIDALIPAVDAVIKREGKCDICDLLEAAAEAAEKGAESTINMTAKKGRAKNIAERSLGHKDPGATSLALIFRGLATGARV
ncbi:MAG: dihydroxyacetone kinase subunit DhaL [Syntrophales bacterium]